VHAVARPSGQPVPAERPELDRVAAAKGWAAHRRTPDLVFALLALVAFVVLLYLGRALTFFGDEWEFITKRQDLTLQNLLGPHSQHWSLFPVLVYKSLVSVVGLHSYLPYLAMLLLVHMTAVAGLFVLLRRMAGPLVALGGATLMLFLGSAYEDLFWAFQIGFVGSVAAGLWALVIVQASIDRRALAAIGGLLFVAVASSGLGLFFLVAVGTLALFDPSRRRVLQPVVAVGIVYLVWFLIFGRTGLDAVHDPFSLAAMAGIPSFVISGGGRGIGGLLGVNLPQNQALFVLLVASVAWRVIRGHHLPSLAVAAVAGLVVQFVIIGMARDQLDAVGYAAVAPRYVYSSAAFLLLALAAFLGEPAKRSVSWRQGLAVALVVGFALIGNLTSLHSGSLWFQRQAVQLRAAIAWLEEHPGSPLIRLNVPPTSYTPVGVSDILALASRQGSVTRDDLLPGVVPRISSATTDQALFGLVKAAFQIRPAGDPVVDPTPPRMTAIHNLTAAPDGGCLSLRATGPVPQLSVAAPAGGSLLFVPEANGSLKAYLSLLAEPQDADSISVDVTGGQRFAIAIPDVGADVPWTLSLVPPVEPMGGQLCSLSSPGP
jgi:hypothetical protein